jgi:hypothetical protein
MIEIKLKNKKVLKISDLHIENVHSRVLAIQKENLHKIYDIFKYPICHWGNNKVGVVKRDNNLIISGVLPMYYVALWITSTPKDEKRDGSYLIIGFFADLKANQSFSDLIDDHLSDLEEIYTSYCVDYDI